MERLVTELRAHGHRAELVRLPTVWDRTRIFDAALAWRFVPLDADLVIATNFPSYFVRHPRKVVWLFHQHRAAYDGFGGPWSDFADDEPSLDAQRLLTEWDSHALGEAVARYATSQVVADRLARFNGLDAEPLYHPPPLFEALHEGPFGDYVLCPTRLEGNKRPELAVAAMAHAGPDVRLVLAGRGTLASAVDASAALSPASTRIERPGFVPDDALVDLFAGALAVLYAPKDEDYGYVTLQAFRAGKPVVTTHDAGGVLEWVEDGVTGIVTDPTPAAIGAAMAGLAADPATAEKLGAAGRERVADLDWAPVVARLTSG
jgi:glycosyltransferase involved in cell wall biosynthesis